jgi:hypothetical protein
LFAVGMVWCRSFGVTEQFRKIHNFLPLVFLWCNAILSTLSLRQLPPNLTDYLL